MPRPPLLPGDPRSPVVLHVPHALRAVPAVARAGLLLDDPDLEQELDRMTDTATDLLAAAAAGAARVRPWRWVNPWSRLVVDPERFPDVREPMRAVGMGAVYTRTSDGRVLRRPDAGHEADLLATWFRPHAEGVADLVHDRLGVCGRAVLLDVHSFPAEPLPYETAGDPERAARRPQVCLGTDPQHTPAWLRAAAREAFAGLDVDLDQPFAGTYTPMRHWQRDLRVASLMVEVRRDVYLDGHLQPTDGLGEVAERLTRLVDAVTDAPPA
ncbi:N-formylglutamate amidohydrolase [Aquipuribacter sp. MA13-6]|uniref:N-formylglutamate amidohydrolase n=1 Tax=unclassified Aquipuribacter TaxID=2635084 RepID=UPI003EEA26EA